MFKLGCDPEFFLKGKRNKWTSAHDLVPGTKHQPVKVPKGAIQADGTAVEFNIEPATTGEEFASNIKTVLDFLREQIPKEYKFQFKPTVTYNSAYFGTVPEHAKLLGCDPDFDAWKLGEMNPRPNPAHGFRTASGHIHIGWTEGADITDEGHLEDCMLVTRRLDYYFSGIRGVWESQDDEERRTLYGNWGCFRPKPYGVEYRVLGNSWLKYPKLWPWLFDFTKSAFQSLEDGVGEDDLPYKASVYSKIGIHKAGAVPYNAIYYGDSFENKVRYANSTIKNQLPKGAPLLKREMLEEVIEPNKG